MDSLHSIVQMPRGIPVATVAIGNATNAGLLAVRILASSNSIPGLMDKVLAFQNSQREEVEAKAEKVTIRVCVRHKAHHPRTFVCTHKQRHTKCAHKRQQHIH